MHIKQQTPERQANENLTEVSDRVLVGVVEGEHTETHTTRDLQTQPAARAPQKLFHFRSAFIAKVKTHKAIYTSPKVATVKQRVRCF